MEKGGLYALMLELSTFAYTIPLQGLIFRRIPMIWS